MTLKDVAYRGVYEYNPDVFAPDSAGAPPSIVLQLVDLKHPSDRNVYELNPDVVARIWNDFGPYLRQVGRPFVASDPALFKHDYEAVCFRFYSYGC